MQGCGRLTGNKVSTNDGLSLNYLIASVASYMYELAGAILWYIYIYKTENTFKNEQRSKDAAAKKRPNTSGVGKINNYYEDNYIPPNNNTN